MSTVRKLVVIFGDQLDREAPVFDDFDPLQDLVWMAEASDESTHVVAQTANRFIFIGYTALP